MRTLRTLLGGALCVMGVLSVACAGSAPEFTDAERSAAEAEVRTVMERFLATQEQLDAAAMVPMFAPDAKMIDFAYIWEGHQAIEQHYSDMFAQWVSWENAWDELEITVMQPDLALAFGRSRLSRTGGDGRVQQTNPNAHFTAMLHATNAGWEIVHMHVSGAIRYVTDGSWP